MKKFLFPLIGLLALAACDRVEPGNVGVMVNTLGDDKGVENKPLGVGRYWTGWSKELHTFPIFQQTRQWTKENNEAITFQTSDGASITGSFAITYQIVPDMVPKIFQTYRLGVDEITDGPIHNAVRNFLQEYASGLTSEESYSTKKNWLLQQVTNAMIAKFKPLGFEIDSISSLGQFDLPKNITDSINRKIIAFQDAEAKKNEIVSEQAQQEINRVRANGEAAAIIAKAAGIAQANATISRSLTPELIQFEMIKKWDGKTPMVQGSSGTPLIQLPPG